MVASTTDDYCLNAWLCYFVTLLWLVRVNKLALLSLCTTFMLEWLEWSNHSSNHAIKQSCNYSTVTDTNGRGMLRKALTASTATLGISRLAAESNFRRPPQPSPQIDDKITCWKLFIRQYCFFCYLCTLHSSGCRNDKHLIIKQNNTAYYGNFR